MSFKIGSFISSLAKEAVTSSLQNAQNSKSSAHREADANALNSLSNKMPGAKGESNTLLSLKTRSVLINNLSDKASDPPEKTPRVLLDEILQKQPVTVKDENAAKVKTTMKAGKSPDAMTGDDYRNAFRRAVYTQAMGGVKLSDAEIKMADKALVDGGHYKTYFNLQGSVDQLRASQKQSGSQMPVNIGKENIEYARRAGQAALQYSGERAKAIDAAVAAGNREMTNTVGGMIQPLVNAPVNALNSITEPARATERMIAGTSYIPEIPRMTAAENSAYWQKDGRMIANTGAEIAATVVLGGATGSRMLATQTGRALLGIEAGYNIAAGTAGIDATKDGENGTKYREMPLLERGLRVTGGVFGARAAINAEVSATNSITNRATDKLADIFDSKPPSIRPQAEMITPEGLRVKVPAGKTPLEKINDPIESRANGFPNQRIPSSDGKWTGKVGNSDWISTKPEVIAITKGKPVPFKNGYPVFDEWSLGEVKLPNMTGKNKLDFKEADLLFAEQKGWFKPDGTPDLKRIENFRSEKNLAWHHHQDGTIMQLVPRDLNGKVPHTGGASVSRNR